MVALAQSSAAFNQSVLRIREDAIDVEFFDARRFLLDANQREASRSFSH